MALINCPKCGKQVSDRALRCPHCGIDVKEYQEQLRQEELKQERLRELEKQKEECHEIEQPPQLIQESDKKGGNHGSKKIIISLIILSLILIGVILSLVLRGSSGTRSVDEGSAASEDIATGSIGGHEYIDLGLPSGLLWATCNVGAENPEDYGDYFAWGETTTKSSYDEKNSATDCKDNSWLRTNGYLDPNGNLTMEYDVANANWGSTWRMPTKADMDELLENTTSTWTTRNGVKGRLLTSKRNGQTIFLPAAGDRSNKSLYDDGAYGFYWTSTPREDYYYSSYYLYFNSDQCLIGWSNRHFGPAVRPVSGKSNYSSEKTNTPSNTISGHEYVDLDLSVKWATCNVGATNPEDFGSYFAWGETTTKSDYSDSNCATYERSISWLMSNGYIDSRGNLTPPHDAARANWGSTWRMPTVKEIEELVDNTTAIWTTHNGVRGIFLTSKRNGKSIFLPAAGSRIWTSLDNEEDNGNYWSSTSYEDNAFNAYKLGFNSDKFGWDWKFRFVGRSVRPVSE